jgi:RND superfamily putative drug exporter
MIDVTSLDDRQGSPARPRPGPLGRLAGLAFRRRGFVLLAWALGLGLATGLSSAFGGDNASGQCPPGSDSMRAQTLLEDRFPAQSGDRVDVVVRTDDVAGPKIRDRVGALLGQMEGMPHVADVDDPYAGEAAVAPDGRTLVARRYLDVATSNDMPTADTEKLLAARAGG